MDRTKAVQLGISVTLAMGLSLVCGWGALHSAPRMRVHVAPMVMAGTGLTEVRGTLELVDLDREQLTMKTSQGRIRVSVDASTTVFLHGQMMTVLDLKPGGDVRLMREGTDGLAVWVEPVDSGPRLAQSSAPPRTSPRGEFIF